MNEPIPKVGLAAGIDSNPKGWSIAIEVRVQEADRAAIEPALFRALKKFADEIRSTKVKNDL